MSVTDFEMAGLTGVCHRQTYQQLESTYVHRVLVDDPHYCPSAFRNLGWQRSTGESLGLVDSDITLAPNWVSAVMSSLQLDSELVIHSRLFNQQDANGFSGTLGISRWVMERIRGYSLALDSQWGYEDTDLIIRAQRAGARAGFYSENLAAHARHTDLHRVESFEFEHVPRQLDLFRAQMRRAKGQYEKHHFIANL